MYSLPMDPEVKNARRGAKIRAKHQITIPMQAMTAAGLRRGDRVRAQAQGRGKVMLTREDDVVQRHAGALSGVYQRNELDELRDEWD